MSERVGSAPVGVLGQVLGSDGPRSWDRATLDSCGDGYTVLRAVRDGDAIADWVVIDANALVRERWAWVVGDVVGVRSSRLDAAADNSRLHAVYAEALATGVVQVFELQLELPAAKGGWRRLTVTPLDRETVSVVTRDISRERSLESALEHERDRTHPLAPSHDHAATDLTADARFASHAAALLFVGSGAVAFTNSLVSDLTGVNVVALRLTGVSTVLCACLVLLLPWERHFRFVANGLVVATLAVLLASEHFDHYSRSRAAIGVYPVFFILLVAWSGLTRSRGTATVTALVSAPALYWIFAAGGQASVGWQCVIVPLPVAAVLGEVLSWNSQRARTLTSLEMQRRLHDPLTGLANRTMLSIRLDSALARVRRGTGALAVLYLDLDHFKQVNDTHGHVAGDDLLIATAASLRAAGRETDTIARIGGDEFVLVCEDLTGVHDATEIAQRILDNAKTTGEHAGTRGERHTLSIGIAFTDIGTETAETLVQNADLALYRAKQAGRARFELYGDDLRHHVEVRRELEHALRAGIPRNELRVYFQPIVSAETGAISSFEALVRWERPGYGLVPPAEFIPIAEETGLIIELGAWVLTYACQQAASWATQWPDRHIGVSVNLSAHQLASGDITSLVQHVLTSSSLDPHLLTLELTESALITNSVRSEAALRALRELGVGLAIDDFGTGYSSLTYLRQLPINIVKIDQSFVRTIGTEREDTAIVAAVINLARNLNIHVVAEGIETPEQLATLVQLHCEHLQGYLFSQPVPANQVAALIGQHPTWVLTTHTKL